MHGPAPRLVRVHRLLLAWLCVLVVGLLGVLLYLSEGMYIGIVLLSAAAMAGMGVIASQLTSKQPR
jgi:hypothetical protein